MNNAASQTKPLNITPYNSPRVAIYRENKLTLYAYEPTTQQNTDPLLIVYALVNRPDILDLQSDCSFIASLAAHGVPVYLIDWGYPDKDDHTLTLSDYILGLLHRCVLKVREHSKKNKINLLGVCQGGVFSLCYSALRGENIHKLITMVSPVDFHTPENILSHIVRHVDVKSCPPWFDMMQQPYDPSQWQHYYYMEKWLHDTPDLAGTAFLQFATELFQQNQLISGTFCLGDERVNLKHILMPVFNIYASFDHLVPPSATRGLADYIGTTAYSDLAFPSGHIGLFTSRKARSHIPERIATWLLHDGSISVSSRAK